MKVRKLFAGIMQMFSKMRLAHKLMLIYSSVLGATIILFASQLINVANNSTELDLINDSRELLKETKYSIDQEIDTCYRTINAITSDYDIMAYIKNWDKSDKTNIFDFNIELSKKVEQIRNLSPNVYQFRVYVSNPNFPEIGSVIYNDSRLANKNDVRKGYEGNPNGYWEIDHIEQNYNTGVLERKNVVSLYVPLKYTVKFNELGIAEATITTETFFRHMFSQSQNENMMAFVIGNKGNFIYDKNGKFATKYGLTDSSLEDIVRGHEIKGEKGLIHFTKDKVSMNLIYDYIDKLESSICYVVTNESITNNLKSKRNLIVVESLLAMVVLCILIYIFTNVLLIKMKQIIASMRKVEEGKLDARVHVRGQDEMSELAYHFNRMLGKIGDLITEVVTKQEAKKNAEIHALFSQINSHFIINTLQNISMMAEIDCRYEVADAINSLGKLLRYSMKWTREYVRLKEEIEYIENYVVLMNIRYDFEIKLDIEIPSEMMEYEILKMMLQPAVENAIHYGIEPTGKNGHIMLTGYFNEDNTVIEIIDNGVGMDEERLKEVRYALEVNSPHEEKLQRKGHGIGLRNVNERIKLFYGNKYGIDINSKKDSFTKIIFNLPPGS